MTDMTPTKFYEPYAMEIAWLVRAKSDPSEIVTVLKAALVATLKKVGLSNNEISRFSTSSRLINDMNLLAKSALKSTDAEIDQFGTQITATFTKIGQDVAKMAGISMPSVQSMHQSMTHSGGDNWSPTQPIR